MNLWQEILSIGWLEKEVREAVTCMVREMDHVTAIVTRISEGAKRKDVKSGRRGSIA